MLSQKELFTLRDHLQSLAVLGTKLRRYEQEAQATALRSFFADVARCCERYARELHPAAAPRPQVAGATASSRAGGGGDDHAG
jgi:hypothetical protein